MTEESKALEVLKQEVTTLEDTERTRECQCFLPRADIFETEEDIFVIVDVPGVDESSIDITLEKNVITINALIEPYEIEGYAPTLTEYEVGDFQRSFRLSNMIDHDKIQASVKDGVLRLQLSKAGEAKTRKISVTAG
jgi:HSP20 family molecular chaperone IbpA